MIKQFADRDTEKFYETGKSKKVPSTIQKVALRKPDYLNAAHVLEDLRIPPGNIDGRSQIVTSSFQLTDWISSIDNFPLSINLSRMSKGLLWAFSPVSYL